MSGIMEKAWRQIVLISMLFPQNTLAAEVGLITEAHSAAGNDGSYLTWFVFVVAVWFVVVLANALASTPPRHSMGFMASIGAGPIAHHLYFPCRLGGRPGHIRTMSPRKAEVLIAAGLHRGDWHDLEIDALSLRAKVLRVSRIRRNGEQLVLVLLKPDTAAKKASIKTLLSDWSGAGLLDADHERGPYKSSESGHEGHSVREANPVPFPH